MERNLIKLINLREATIDDTLILFNWRNDIDVRKNSFNIDEVNYNNHIDWFETKLVSNNSRIYILENDNKPMGVIRLDDMDNDYKLINFSIDSKYRGQGYGSQLLELIKIKFEYYILVGEVKENNIGSIKAFQKARYFMKEKIGYLEFYSKDV